LVFSVGIAWARMSSSAAITAPRSRLFRPKPQTSPKPAITAPPIIGPMKRAPFISAELKAIAFGRSSLPPTSSTSCDWRAGESKALTRPSTRFASTSCQTATWPKATSASIASDCASATVWVMRSTLRFFCRSTHTPAKGPSTSSGMCSMKVDRPSMKAEPDSS
jgi:hypothetical protein